LHYRRHLVAQYLKYLENGRIEPPGGYELGRYWADLATDMPQMLREGRLFRYHAGFFECTWNSADPLPAFLLWTLFPLIALENLVISSIYN
jgi:hypothetical protein